MKLEFVLLIALLFALIIDTNALNCYHCVRGVGTSGYLGIPYHERCKHGSLPDEFLRPCHISNVINSKTLKPYSPTEIDRIMMGGPIQFACSKSYIKIDKLKVAVKRCTLDGADEADGCNRGSADGIRMDSCVCHTDRCNSANGLVFSLGSIFALMILTLKSLN